MITKSIISAWVSRDHDIPHSEASEMVSKLSEIEVAGLYGLRIIRKGFYC